MSDPKVVEVETIEEGRARLEREFERRRAESFEERAHRCLEVLRELDDLTQYLHSVAVPRARSNNSK